MRRGRIVGVTISLLASAAMAQVRISGVVTEVVSDGKPIPVPEAYVLASAGLSGDIVGEALTDSRGRYSLDVPPGRYKLTAKAQGRYTVRAGGRDVEAATLVCLEAGECGGADFELARAAVVEGWLTDAYGEPLAGAEVALTPEADLQLTDRVERYKAVVGRATADDRGYFRIWGLKPGRYGLEAPAGQVRLIEIEPGQRSVEARIELGASGDGGENFRLSGVIEGLPEGDQPDFRMVVRRPERDYGGSWSRVEPDGRFDLAVRGGEYALLLVGTPGDGNDARFLAEIEVNRNLEDLRIPFLARTGIRGRLEFVDAPPQPLLLMLTRPGGPLGSHVPARATGPEHQFGVAGLMPAEFDLRVESGEYYVIEPARITVQPGRIETFTVRVGNQRGAVRGVVRREEESKRAPLPFATVLLNGRENHKAQADGEGRFVFRNLIPGLYSLRASESPDALPDGGPARTVVLEPGFEVEVDLTVTP